HAGTPAIRPAAGPRTGAPPAVAIKPASMRKPKSADGKDADKPIERADDTAATDEQVVHQDV
ncbi:MAG: hypothetical protein HOQ24_06680, partial [Mycobacteriaceae bacterium]|nr:hypothetical protein [Mycobacteriaceae bacterium]